MRESAFQSRFIKKLKRQYPGCHILKNDSDYQQGIPDLLLLWQDKWAMFEVKAEEPGGPHDFEPNQEWFIGEFATMSFAACVYPENEKDVLDALQATFRLGRQTRYSQREQVSLD